MPAKDIYHDCVKLALQKEGWIITADPLYIQSGNEDFYVDLGAERIIAAEKGNEKIAIEIKSFSAPSRMYAFHEAVGQYWNYSVALQEEHFDRTLFLAIPLDVYESFFERPFVKKSIELANIKLLVFDADNQMVVEWKK